MAHKSITTFAHFKNPQQQARFMERVLLSLKVNQTGLSLILKTHVRNVSGWVSGEHMMPYNKVTKCATLSGISLPAGLKKILWSDHLRIIAKKGARSMAKMRKNPTYEAKRKIAWSSWWETKGRFLPRKTSIMDIRKPRPSTELAEFVGILMGDGTIAPYYIAITLNSDADADYVPFVQDLIKRLFRTDVKTYQRKDCRATEVVVHRKALVDFAHSLGLPRGNKLKQGLYIPEWIRTNDKYAFACIRGLVDTDGCLFRHTYTVNGKVYSYPKLCFTSRSLPLVMEVHQILKKAGLSARISKDGCDVRIESVESVEKYFRIIGTSNPRIAQIYKECIREKKLLFPLASSHPRKKRAAVVSS